MITELRRYVDHMIITKAELVGFNNLRYDYPVLHAIIYSNDSVINARYIRSISDRVFNNKAMGGFAPVIWNPLIPQWDLLLIHHFNNENRMVSLKAIEFWQRAKSIDEFELGFDKAVPLESIPRVHEYNYSDVLNTEQFLKFSMPMIQIRHDLMQSGEGGGKCMRWFNNGKIGANIIIKMLGIHPKARGTYRESVYLGDVMSSMISIEHVPQFKMMFDFLSDQTVYKTAGAFDPDNMPYPDTMFPYVGRVLTKTEKNKLIAIENHRHGVEDYPRGTLAFMKRYLAGEEDAPTGKVKKVNIVHDGLQYDFGTGGLHASRHNQVYRSDEEHVVLDWDFKAWYPSLGRVLGIAPEQFDPVVWQQIMAEIARLRDTFKKGTAGYQAYKDAGNVPYGQSGFDMSPFYDPKYMLAICLNGQMLLISLIDWLYKELSTVKMIQANTDGITFVINRSEYDQATDIRLRFQAHIGVVLEEAIYKSMHIRDVGSYIAVDDSGKVKAKGAYLVDKEPHKNSSSLVVQKAVMAHLLHGVEIEDYIYGCEDNYDFMKMAKVNRGFKALTRDCDTVSGGNNHIIKPVHGKVIRYYCSNRGIELIKKSKVTTMRAETKSYITLAQTVPDELTDINYQYYVDRAYDLLNFKEVEN